MLHRTEIIYLANQENLLSKKKLASSLVQEYRNAKVAIILISNKHSITDSSSDINGIELIHYPTNRKIEPHIILFQRMKLNPNGQTIYLTGQPINITSKNQTGPILDSTGQCVGFQVDNQTALNDLLANPNAINSLKRTLASFAI